VRYRRSGEVDFQQDLRMVEDPAERPFCCQDQAAGVEGQDQSAPKRQGRPRSTHKVAVARSVGEKE
jgi:hypothetical protein